MTKKSGFLALPDHVLANLDISVHQIVEVVEKAIQAEARGEIFTAPKSAVLPGTGRYMMTTLSTADNPRITVVKSVMVSPRNPARGLNGVEGAILLQDSETGQLLVVMGSGWITAVRTAGLSAVVAKRLANPNSETIAFIGCGVQARSHLEAFSSLFPLKEIRAYGRGQENIARLCDLVQARGLDAKECTSPRDAIENADLVVSSVTLSFELEPFLDATWLKAGAFATITDAAKPWMPRGWVGLDTVIIDDIAQEKAMETKLLEPALVTTDLKGLVAAGNEASFDASKRSAFIFRGIAIGDFALADLAYSTARRTGAGDVVAWD
jgi:ornithine cyclodeaminase/alanine dehydrogenase-like protein (mu-crystallin family)